MQKKLKKQKNKVHIKRMCKNLSPKEIQKYK